MIFGVGEQVSAMYAKPALLVVILLSIGRLAHQQSVGDDYDPGKTDDNVKSSAVGLSELHAAMNAIKRHIGKFVRIGRSSSDDVLHPDDDFWSLYYAPSVPRLSERLLGSRRRRSDLYNYGDRTIMPKKFGLTGDTLADYSTVDELPVKLKKNNRGGGVRFVRIGRMSRNYGPSDINVIRRSLENRFVRIGK